MTRGQRFTFLGIALAIAVVLTLTSGLEFARDVVRHRRGEPATAPG